MTPLYNTPYEELSEDIFAEYRRQKEAESRHLVVIATLDINLDISDSLKAEIIRLFDWANEQGLKGFLATNLTFDKCDGEIRVTCEVAKQFL